MVTVTSFNGKPLTGALSLVGLSTDTKPTETISEKKIMNGSTYFEMDTGNVYIFSESDKIWHLV